MPEPPRPSREPLTAQPADAETPPRGATSPHELTDAEFGRLFKFGALAGIPTLYVILFVIVSFAAPGHPGLLVGILLPAIFGGWYFGGIVVLTVVELRQEKADRQPDAGRSPRRARKLARRRPVPAP